MNVPCSRFAVGLLQATITNDVLLQKNVRQPNAIVRDKRHSDH